MNPGILFLPVFRASTTAFLLGLVVLAVADYFRITSGLNPSLLMLTMLVMIFFVFSLHANRRRYVERGAALGLLPVGLAMIAKFLGWFGGIVMFAMGSMVEFAAENGVDVDADATLGEALADPDFVQAIEDPQFIEAFSAWAETNEAMNAAAAAAGGMPSFIGFWIVILAFAPWFALMKRRGGTIEHAASTPGRYDPEPAAAPQAEESPADDTSAGADLTEDALAEAEADAADDADAAGGQEAPAEDGADAAETGEADAVPAEAADESVPDETGEAAETGDSGEPDEPDAKKD